MQARECLSLEQIRAFLEASNEVGFKGRNREEVYAFVSETLRQQRYHDLKRRSRGLIRRYLTKMTGLSRAQITRLVSMYLEGDPVQPKAYGRNRFAKRYTREDIALLAAVDEAHETRSGPATQKLLQRAYHEFKESQYQRLAELSVAQMYQLRKSHTYRQRLVTYQSTQPSQVAIGERRTPAPDERPRYQLHDSVQPGNRHRLQGVGSLKSVEVVKQGHS